MSDAFDGGIGWDAGPERNGAELTPLPLPPDEPDVRWAAQADLESDLVWVPVIRAPKSGEPIRGIGVNTHVQGAWVHWIDGRTVPCRRQRRTCDACLAGCVARMVGYILVARSDLLPAMFELPAGLIRSRPGLLSDEAALRGRSLTLKRHPRGRSGYVSLEVSDKPARLAVGAELPADEDIRPILLRIWEAR